MKKTKRSISKRAVLVGVVLVMLLMMWVIPFQARNISVSLLTDRSLDGQQVAVTITADEAYRREYTFETTVSGGALTFFVPHEYIDFDSIMIHDPAVVASSQGLRVLSTGLFEGDYVSASCEGTVLQPDGSLTALAVETIEDGRGNQWFSKLIITVVVLLLALSVVAYRRMKACMTVFKAVMVLVLVWMAVLIAAACAAFSSIGITLNLAGYAVSSLIPVAVVAVVALLMLAACVVCDRENRAAKRLIAVIYLLASVFALGKMMFYNEKVARTPDEMAHISYIASLEEHEEWFVPFEGKPLAAKITNDTETLHAAFQENTVNNLRHPPLYYWIVDAVDSVTFLEDGTFLVDLDRMRGVGIAMTMATLALMFYIGYTRLKKLPLVHMLFATICVSVPMLTYVASGVNNDTLTFLTVTLFFLGLLRYCEKKRNTATYLLIAVGISATLLTKLTAGLMVVAAALIVLVTTVVREKNTKELLSRPFLVTIPLYLLAATYYVFIFIRYGALQPSFTSLNEAYAHSTGLYPAPAERGAMGLLTYIGYFFGMFFMTWTGISGHIRMLKPAECAFLEFVGLSLLLFIPLFLLSKSIRRGLPHAKPMGAMYAGMLITLVVQMVNGYNILMERGYLGGIQSRYYLCAVVVLALCAALLVQKVLVTTDKPARFAGTVRGGMIVLTVMFTAVLFYEDIIYFLLHYQNYLL